MTYKYAALATEFRLTIDEILDLSPRQREDIYFHRRDKDGKLTAPDDTAIPASAPGSRVAQLIAMIESGLVKATPEQLAELKRRAAEWMNS